MQLKKVLNIWEKIQKIISLELNTETSWYYQHWKRSQVHILLESYFLWYFLKTNCNQSSVPYLFKLELSSADCVQLCTVGLRSNEVRGPGSLVP